ncbi:MAG: pseudouridine synthase [Patescibacteria group bacterium]
MEERLNAYIAKRSRWSRRAIDALIDSQQVMVNGRIATLGQKVSDADVIMVSGETISTNRELPTYYMLNKPIGWITTTASGSQDNVMAMLPPTPRVYPVGRLDVSSSGLLLLTNDGELAVRLTHPRYQHEKEYEVTVAEPIGDADLEQFRNGMLLAGEFTLPAKVKRLTTTTFRIAIRQGRNRQIRRMCEARAHTVVSLRRTRIVSLQLANLPVGQWRTLTKDEVHHLREAVGLSTITPPPITTSPS